MAFKYKPLKDRIIVRPQESEKVTKGGIIIPDTARERAQVGEVVAVSEQEDLVVKVGDDVYYGKNSGVEIVVDGTVYLMMREAEVFALIEKENG